MRQSDDGLKGCLGHLLSWRSKAISTVTPGGQERVAPNNLIDVSSLFKNCNHGLHVALFDVFGFGLPFFLGLPYPLNVSLSDPSLL